MAPSATMTDHDLSLHTSALELKYERSVHLVDIIAKDENVRKLRFDKHVLEDDNTELRELLLTEQERSDKLEAMMNDHLVRAEAAEAAVQSLEAVAQTKEQEISTLQAERNALKNLTTDTSKIMTEKLELTHELSRLRPELEHLRAQATTNEILLTEKLSLQRKLSEIEVELENAKRDAQRAMAKRRNTMHEVAQEDELESLRKTLSKEKRLHERAKETIGELQAELDEAKKSSQRELAAESKKAEQTAETEVRAEELVRNLAREQKEKSKAERALATAQADFDSNKAVLEDKLTQYKNRVRTLKDRLKETESALEEAQAAATKAAATAAAVTKSVTIAPAATKQHGNGRKRAAASLEEADATTLGTPGDAPAKRARKGANVGEKSSFSITPFLNRTLSVAADDEEAEDADPHAKSDDEEPDAEATPTAAAKKRAPTTKPTKKQPLQPIPATKQNIKKPSLTTSKTTKIPLQVVEEDPNEDATSSVKKPKTKPAAAPSPPAAADTENDVAAAVQQAKKKPKVRKSLATFAAFNLEPEPEKKKAKARKLGGLGKTLFDEEDDAPAKGLPGTRGLFGGVGKMGPLAGLARGSFLAGAGGVGKKGPASRTEDGFVFSPLKRDRKAGMSFVK
ncbi:hypothetical protein K461DRAFT_295261 [Myriangium duriaei CBS 260.36]|uniref:Uncharacterized protein n=1 Tax=Myriangium duriaei CBS 260.36 TaxID=1168546 RepID=A0A9P4MIM1_9PEZI|nr:hypothetical protein K461DRAFT_295261 [Myriangium duriaei CBS 260.36]